MNELICYKLILSFKGTNYRGWQPQPDNPNTIQIQIEKILADIVNHQAFKISSAGRTDAGVHASGFVVKIELPIKTEPHDLMKGINSKLPSDIQVIDCEYVDSSFNPNRDSKLKEYHYYFIDKNCENSSMNEILYYHPKKLNLDLMKQACSLFIGNHDFKAFSSKIKTSQTHRNITKCSIEKTSFKPFEQEVHYLKIEASGYLTYMVRYITGTLFNVGLGETTLTEVKQSLSTGSELRQRLKAPSHGLHLININY